MSTKYIASNWRLPNEENSNKSDNYGLSFSGNEHIDTNHTTLLNGKDSFSISCWIKPTSIDNNDSILISRGSSYILLYLGVTSGNYFATIQTAGTTYTSSTAGNLSLNQWNHIVATGTVGSKLNIYVNSNLENTTQGSGNMTTLLQDASFLIGKDPVFGRYFQGNIDEVAIFDYALSARQIKQDIYDGTTSGKTADLNNNSNLTAPIAWYRMGD